MADFFGDNSWVGGDNPGYYSGGGDTFTENPFNYGNFSQDQLNSIGWDGDIASPYQFSSEGTGTGADAYSALQGYSPDFMSYLQKQGLTPRMTSDESGFHSGFFNNKNQMVGPANQWSNNNDPFGIAVALLSSGMGGMAGGATAAGYGAGAAGQAIGAGAGAGMGGAAWNSMGDPKATLIGGATGALGGGVAGLNPAQYAGITDPSLATIFNKAAGSAVATGLQGGNPLTAAGTSALGGGLGYGMQQGANAMFPSSPDTSYDSWNFDAPPSGEMSMPVGGLPPSELSTAKNDMFGYSAAPGYNVAQNFSFPMGAGSYSPMSGSPNAAAPQSQQQQANPLLDGLRKGLNFATGGDFSRPGAFDNIAGNLLQMWQSRRNSNQYGNLAGNLQSLYGPNSAYAQQLRQQLTRQDAAAGRRSQYGNREVELQARLADTNARMAPTLQSLYGQQQNNQAQVLQSLLRMSPGLLRMFQNNNQGNMTGYNPASDYSYQNGSDLGFPVGP